jgi:hypothetical protein
MPVPFFVTFKLQNLMKSICDIKRFYIQKTHGGIDRKVRNATGLKYRMLLVEVCNEK